MPVFYDQLNREVNLSAAPQKIISTVPSQTELLFYLGIEGEIIGISNFCTHPKDKTKSVKKIGGTKKLDVELIKTLKPDLIIANKEENDRGQVEELMDVCPVWISDVNDLPGAISMVESIGEMLNCQNKAKELTSTIFTGFNQIKTAHLNLRVAYLIWRKPYMVAGTRTFINSMLLHCGLTNAFDTSRYPEVNTAMLIAARPNIILLSSEPYPFSNKHIAEFEAMLPNTKILLVDGDMFSWYGSRLLYAPAYFIKLIRLIKLNT
jgi:ABC-type Fe3+-hydroxamate transport system substrate-binding protein